MNNQPRDRVEWIMLDDAKQSLWLQYTGNVAGQKRSVGEFYVMVYANRRHQVKALVRKWNLSR
jgi:hypothetical protein